MHIYLVGSIYSLSVYLSTSRIGNTYVLPISNFERGGENWTPTFVTGFLSFSLCGQVMSCNISIMLKCPREQTSLGPAKEYPPGLFIFAWIFLRLISTLLVAPKETTATSWKANYGLPLEIKHKFYWKLRDK